MTDTKSKTVEDLKKEAEEAEKRFRDATKKAQEAEHKKAEQREREIQIAKDNALKEKMVAAFDRLAVELRRVSVPCRILLAKDGTPFIEFGLKGLPQYGSHRVSLDKHYGSYNYYSRRAEPKLKFTVGDYGNRKSYFERKDGTFNIAGIVNDVKARIKASLDNQERERIKSDKTLAAKTLINQLYNDLGINPDEVSSAMPELVASMSHSSYLASHPADDGMVYIAFPKCQWNPDEAMRIMTLFDGIMKERETKKGAE